MKELTLEITNRCNLDCPWCGSSSTPNGKHCNTMEMIKILEKYKDICDVVRVSGGEPTLHPDLEVIIKRAKDLSYKVVLLTNGTNIYNESKLLFPQVDEYWIGLAPLAHSIQRAVELRTFFKVEVGMQIVLEEYSKVLLPDAVKFGLLFDIPLRLLALQKQGRGVNCEPLDLISWTGDKGCQKENKITITHDGKVITCSALKYKEECDVLCNERAT